MTVTDVVDLMIKLFEHIGPCAALLLVLHWQNIGHVQACLERLDAILAHLRKEL